MSTFKYQPIDSAKRQIRLLKILPLKRDSAEECLTDPTKWTAAPSTCSRNTLVTCTLETVSLDDNPMYLALSYTWGDPSICKTIQIESVDGKSRKTFEVTVNLEQALRYFRQENHPVRLWADAICIDQTNDTEKTEQVQQMRDIYGKSTSAIVWLGPAAADSDNAMDALDRVGKEALEAGILDLRKDDFLSWPHPDPDGRRSAKQRAIDDLAHLSGIDFPHQALKLLSERNYWTRVWIVQEISVPREVTFMCGYKRLSFRHFAAAIIFLGFRRRVVLRNTTAADLSDQVRGPALTTMLSTYPNPALGVLIGARRKYQRETGVPETLMELLVRGCVVASSSESDRKASDRRDRIYGLLGLSSDAEDLNIRPDYSKTTEQGYANVARVLIEHGYTDILSWCQTPKKLKDLPSWVPDFSSPIRDPCGEPQKFGLFSASGQHAVFSLPIDSCYRSNVLALAGTGVDTIISTGCLWAPGLDCDFKYNAADALFMDIEKFCQLSQGFSSTISQDTEKWAEAVWRIPCADQKFTANARRRRASSTAIRGYHELKQRIAGSSELQDQLHSTDCQGYVIAMEYLHNRRPFLSTKGYVGLIPAHSEPGDLICIIFGAIVPFVLRKLQNGQYELIGEAYVHGIMDGEFMETCPISEIFHLR
jgi:hypothetical protein